MNQLDSNRFNTFGNESDRNTICSTQRARKPPSIQKYSSEPTSQRALTSNEVQNQKQEFITCHTESSGDSQVGHPDDFDLKENLMKGMVSPQEGQLLGTLDLKQFEMDKSMENTFKTALSKLTSGNATMKEDFKNTLSLMFPCDYFIPGSISNSVVYNKTILEVSESEREGGLERQNVSKALADLAKRHPFAKKKIEDQRDGDYQDALQHMKQCAMKDEVMSDQFTGPESHSTRRTKATEESDLKSNRPSEKADLMNEFKGLKKEVTAIQKDLRVSDDYNKKLEEHIYQQSCQIMQVLKNFNMINEENGILKQQLAGALRKSTSKETEKPTRMQMGKYDQIDHIVARKAVKFLTEEISQLKTRHEKIIRNHENIIQDLQIQLRSRDTELEELRKHNREEHEARALNDLFLFQPKRSFADNRKSDYELHSLREGHGQAVDIKRSGFYTPNRMRPLNELKPSDSHEKHYDVKTSKSTRNMGDITSSGSFNYHKQAKEFIKDLQRSKGRDKENIPRDSYTGGKTQDGKAPLGKSSSQLTPSHFQGELSSKGRERSGSTTKAHKEGKDSSQSWNEKGLHFEQFNMREMKEKKREKEKGGKILMSQDGVDFGSEDESKKSMVDISFEISYLKENIDKRLESELNSLNISPAKEKESKSRSSQRHQTKKPLHNNSQFNEISIINEQPSENFMTESVHTKLISELQSHPDSIKKQRPEEVEINYMKAPKEYSSSRTRGEEYMEKRNSHSSGLTPKEYPGYSHDMKAREHYSNSRRDTTSYVKENAEQYHASQSKRSKKDVVPQEEKSGEQYKRSKSSEKPIKAQAHILQQGSSHRLPSDASEERKPRKEETPLEKGYREYLKELADKSKKQPKSESHMHSNTHEKSSRHAQNRSKERSSHHDRHHPAEKQVSHHTHNDTIVNLNMALEKMLEKDVDKGNYKSNKHRSARPDENDRHEVIPEQDDLQIEYRSRSSGHSGHRKKSATPSSHLQLQAPNQSSKTISSRAEGNELISRKNHDKDYDRMYNEGEYHLPTGPVTNKSSRRQFYGLKEDLNNFNSCEGDGFTGGQTSTHAGKPRLDPSRGGPTKSVTPTGAYNNKIQMYKGSNEAASQSQTHLGRESKSSRRSHQNVQGEPVVRNMNSFEHGTSSGTGRNSSVGHSKSGSGIAKGDKYAYNSTKYQMGPYNDISIVDYKYPDELIRNEEARAQHSTNDFVNFDSVLHHEREINGIYKSNNSSFVLFHNTNLDSINSSTVFEAFPTKKGSNQKDMSKAPAQGGYSTKFMKHL